MSKRIGYIWDYSSVGSERQIADLKVGGSSPPSLMLLERCESGRIGRSRKPLYRKVPGVRIPLSPFLTELHVQAFSFLCTFRNTLKISILSGAFNTLERCPSGRRYTIGSRVCPKGYRGFESLSLRTGTYAKKVFRTPSDPEGSSGRLILLVP